MFFSYSGLNCACNEAQAERLGALAQQGGMGELEPSRRAVEGCLWHAGSQSRTQAAEGHL